MRSTRFSLALALVLLMTGCDNLPKSRDCKEATENTLVAVQTLIYRYEDYSIDEYLLLPQDEDLVKEFQRVNVDLDLIGDCEIEYDMLMIDRIDEVKHTTSTGAWLKAEMVKTRASRILDEYLGTAYQYVKMPEEEVHFEFQPDKDLDSCEEIWAERLRLLAEAGAVADRTSDNPSVRENATSVFFTVDRITSDLVEASTNLGCDTEDALDFLLEHQGGIPDGGFWTRVLKYRLFDYWS